LVLIDHHCGFNLVSNQVKKCLMAFLGENCVLLLNKIKIPS
jgi:hypothetical protein